MKKRTVRKQVRRALPALLPMVVPLMVQLAEKEHKRRSLQMPGDPRYQPDPLKPFLGYDMWAGWLIVVEWAWMLALAHLGVMPARDAKLLTPRRLKLLLECITTKLQDDREYGRDNKPGTRHDIKALIELMRRLLPRPLHRWLHYSATSYDIISTAYALIAKTVFEQVVWPKLVEVDGLWRQRIAEHVSTLQMGRTHLQHALPITAGFWLATLHSRYVSCANMALRLVRRVPGKFSGMVGTYAAQDVLVGKRQAEKTILQILGLPGAPVTTQIAPPEAMARFYLELLLLSGSLANFGEDVRKLQANEYGEVMTFGSTSSTGAHKTANPIAAENACGMHANIIAEAMKVQLTLSSDFQRDLRWSSVMRSFGAVIVYLYQQLTSVERMLKTMSINVEACDRNFWLTGSKVTAELLHLSLQRAGYGDSHRIVNQELVPMLNDCSMAGDLGGAAEAYIDHGHCAAFRRAWRRIPPHVKTLIANPDRYTGRASAIARHEVKNALKAL